MTPLKPRPVSAAKTHLPRQHLVVFRHEMLLIRRFEEKVEEPFRGGELAGFLHACIGQEAVAVGVCSALSDGDVIASTHRAHGHVIANGTPPSDVMAELYGTQRDRSVCGHAAIGDVCSGVTRPALLTAVTPTQCCRPQGVKTRELEQPTSGGAAPLVQKTGGTAHDDGVVFSAVLRRGRP